MMGLVPDARRTCITAGRHARCNAGRLTRRARRLLDRARRSCTRRPGPPSPGSTSRRLRRGARPVARARAASCALGVLDRRGLRAETRGRIWSQLGLLHMRTGARRTPLADVRRGHRRCLEGTPEPRPGPAQPGQACTSSGATPARPPTDLTAPRSTCRRGRRPVERAKAAHNLGYARLLRGDLVGALQAMDAARVVLAPLSPVEPRRGRAGPRRGADRGRPCPRGRSGARRPPPRRTGRAGCGTFQAECELTLARTLLRGDPARARVVARRAARRFRGQGSEAPGAARRRRRGGRRRSRSGGRSPALLRADRRAGHDLHAPRAPPRRPDRSGSRRPGWPLRRGDLDDAAEQARPRPRRRRDSPSPFACSGGRCAPSWPQARGDGRRARDHVRAGLTDLHAWQSSFGSLDLQSTLVGHGRDLALQGLRLALDDGSARRSAYEWSERARALVAPGDAGAAARPTSSWPADLTELRVLHAAQPAPHSADGRRLRPAARPHPAAAAGTATAGATSASRPRWTSVQAELDRHRRVPGRAPRRRRPADRRRRDRDRRRRASRSGEAEPVRRTWTRSPPTWTWRPRSWPARSPPPSAARSTSGSVVSPSGSSVRCCR